MSFRAEKIASTIKKIIAQSISDISHEISAGFATLTSVKITKDLQLVKCYVSLYGKNSQPGKLIETLENRKHELKHLVAKEIRLRYIPEFKFYIDNTLDEMEKIHNLIQNVKNSENNSNEENSD